MNKKKRNSFLILSALLLTVLAGCMANQEEQTDDMGKTKKNNGFSITITEKERYKDRDPIEKDPPKDVVKLKMEIKNESNGERGIGSLDFKAFDKKGEEIPHYGYADNFGDVVGIGKTLHGSVYFVAKEKGIAKIQYTDPDTAKTTTWNLSTK